MRRMLTLPLALSSGSVFRSEGFRRLRQCAPRGSVATVAGIVSFSNQLSGIAAPIVTGYVVSATRSYAWAFGISAIYLLIGISSYLFLLGRIESTLETVGAARQIARQLPG